MLILGIDPGVESPGYAVWCSEQRHHVYVGATFPWKITERIGAVVVESGFIGRIGKLGMWGLGFGAGIRVGEAKGTWPDISAYTIRPDGKAGWRAALIQRNSRDFAVYDGLPKDVLVNKLRHRYQMRNPEDGAWTDDMVEACGIAEAAATILARPKASQRKALKPVRFG